MNSPVASLVAVGALVVGFSQAFLAPNLPVTMTTANRHARRSSSCPSTASRPEHHRLPLRRGPVTATATSVLRMADNEGAAEAAEPENAAEPEEAAEEEAPNEVAAEEEKAAVVVPNVTEMMESAKEADYVARAQASSVAGPTVKPSGVVGPAMQPAEDKKKEQAEFELNKPKENKWASGAFRRGVVIQAVVLAFVVYLQFQPDEVGNLAICAPFSKDSNGCVDFGQWFEIVFLGAPIPPM